MAKRREIVVGLLGAGVAASLPANSLLAATARSPGKAVTPARLTRPPSAKSRPPFLPLGEARTFPADYDYVEEEWFASGTDDDGRPYTTQVVVRRPRDPRRFSGTLIAEPLHASAVAPIYMYSSRYILRSGHAWACIGSQKAPVDNSVKKADPAHYAALHIEPDVNADATPNAAGMRDAAGMAAMIQRMSRSSPTSNAILAQVGAALRTQGPFVGFNVRHILLVGHSQTGIVSSGYIRQHDKYRLAGGRPVYDGYMPSGYPGPVYGPRDVPLILLVSDGDTSDESFRLAAPGRGYRRPDSDDPKDRFRLYELGGVPHMGTRNPPNSDPGPWSQRTPGVITPGLVMNTLPHNELFNMALDHLVQWAAKGVAPPRAERIAVAADGRYFAKDEYGNTVGGIRCVQMDVPHSTYLPNPRNPDGSLVFGTFGLEQPFDKERMKALYGTPGAYVQRYNQRLAELIQQGWLLGADATGMRDEALSQTF